MDKFWLTVLGLVARALDGLARRLNAAPAAGTTGAEGAPEGAGAQPEAGAGGVLPAGSLAGSTRGEPTFGEAAQDEAGLEAAGEDGPPAHWQAQFGPGGPPAHWLKEFERAGSQPQWFGYSALDGESEGDWPLPDAEQAPLRPGQDNSQPEAGQAPLGPGQVPLRPGQAGVEPLETGREPLRRRPPDAQPAGQKPLPRPERGLPRGILLHPPDRDVLSSIMVQPSPGSGGAGPPEEPPASEKETFEPANHPAEDQPAPAADAAPRGNLPRPSPPAELAGRAVLPPVTPPGMVLVQSSRQPQGPQEPGRAPPVPGQASPDAGQVPQQPVKKTLPEAAAFPLRPGQAPAGLRPVEFRSPAGVSRQGDLPAPAGDAARSNPPAPPPVEAAPASDSSGSAPQAAAGRPLKEEAVPFPPRALRPEWGAPQPKGSAFQPEGGLPRPEGGAFPPPAIERPTEIRSGRLPAYPQPRQPLQEDEPPGLSPRFNPEGRPSPLQSPEPPQDAGPWPASGQGDRPGYPPADILAPAGSPRFQQGGPFDLRSPESFGKWPDLPGDLPPDAQDGIEAEWTASAPLALERIARLDREQRGL